jgi:7-carboxy-7-deazaguanine synthase (Cx14CxxC type)
MVAARAQLAISARRASAIGKRLTVYTVKEIYTTLQGEGAQTGRAAVFLRFAGCNLWSGLERDRASAVCQFCDTDFVGTDGPGGGKFAGAGALADAVAKAWMETAGNPPSRAKPYVVCTGGEPLLQLDETLIEALHARGFEIAIETNGTQAAPAGIDWICVSPKANAPLVLTSGDELKLVFPQEGAEPQRFERLDFRHFFLQPMDSACLRANIEAAARYCLRHPQWRLSLQTHKLIGLP